MSLQFRRLRDTRGSVVVLLAADPFFFKEHKGAKNGYDIVIDKIVNRTVDLPKDLNVFELNTWLNAYAECQKDVIDIIVKLRGDCQRI